jgi:lipopolysaccharide transport system permease protein
LFASAVNVARDFNLFFSILHRRKDLIRAMVRSELFLPYAGQALGSFWSFGHVIFLLGVYAFIFNIVFEVRVGAGMMDLPLNYTVYILSGLVPWLSFQQALIKGSIAVTSNASFVKQIVFPIEILPIKTAIAASIISVIGAMFIILYVLVSQGRVPISYAFLPVLIFIQLLGMIGASYILSSINVFFKDTKDFIQLFSTINIFIIPAIYLPEAIPSKIFNLIIMVNPFSHMVWVFQDVLFYCKMEHPISWIIFLVLSIFVFLFGFRVFMRSKQQFGTML